MNNYLFTMNNMNQVEEFESFLSENNTFGDNTKVICRSDYKENDYQDWVVIDDSFSKKDALILDMVGLYNRHGHPNDPDVHEKGEKIEASEQVRREDVCPECGAVVIDKCEDCDIILADFNADEEVNYLGKPREMQEIDMEIRKFRCVERKIGNFTSQAGNKCKTIDFILEDGRSVRQFYAVDFVRAGNKFKKMESLVLPGMIKIVKKGKFFKVS